MKEDEQRSSFQKQMLINRLYKTKNNNNKQLPKPEQDTNLLFYVPSLILSKQKSALSAKKNPKKSYH